MQRFTQSLKSLQNQKQDRQFNIFWFRRDLRIEDNTALYHALQNDLPVLAVFIFDTEILDELTDDTDARVNFIHGRLAELKQELKKHHSDLLILHGEVSALWQQLIETLKINAVYTNHDYEPYARNRDDLISDLLQKKDIPFHTYKDQVIFEKNEILTQKDQPYTVYSPYRKSWQDAVSLKNLEAKPSEKHLNNLANIKALYFPALADIGFSKSDQSFPSKDMDRTIIKNYHKTRNYPYLDGTTRLGLHLRFGTISIRHLVKRALEWNEVFLGELVWREFFMMILWQHPHVVDKPFREKYAAIPWRDDDRDFERWKNGQTGYPIVDAGMRQLNESGYMHNRVRMISASFLTKHLLIDWRRGERYFAEKLLDYELSSNNGNWQWAAGCGCDAAPYFRVFNPETQQKKFDPDLKYIKKWIPELDKPDYPAPIIEHRFARERALDHYKKHLD